MGKESSFNALDAGDADSTPVSGRSPEGGHGNPLLYSCLKNPMTEEPDGLQSIGSQTVEHDCSDRAHMQPL